MLVSLFISSRFHVCRLQVDIYLISNSFELRIWKSSNSVRAQSSLANVWNSVSFRSVHQLHNIVVIWANGQRTTICYFQFRNGINYKLPNRNSEFCGRQNMWIIHGNNWKWPRYTKPLKTLYAAANKLSILGHKLDFN